jgi:hypothetical protein
MKNFLSNIKKIYICKEGKEYLYGMVNLSGNKDWVGMLILPHCYYFFGGLL